MAKQEKERDFVLKESHSFSKEDAKVALEMLMEYKEGKNYVDQKATENQQWWRLRHWQVLAERNEGVNADVGVGSAWAVNSIINKHADMMDSFPAPNILPREADDEIEAKALSDVIPAILAQNDYEEVYRDMAWDFAIDGTAITGVFWDSTKHDGLGDIAISNIDVHNLFWKPGIKDIQESDKVFYVSLEDVDVLKTKWPNIANKIGPNEKGTIVKYMHDDNIDTTNCAEVVEMYYKKTEMRPVDLEGMDENGQPTKIHITDVPRDILHYAVIIGGEVAFCSENEQGYENGYYEHGKYPFVIRRLFPVKDSPCGFGYLDIMKNPQKDIDKLDQSVIYNAMAKARPRYFGKKNANIDMAKFANWDEQIVEVGSGDPRESVMPIEVQDVPSGAISHLANKIDELKEVSNNRDFNQGGISGGVSAASAIAALQEAGSKTARDMNKELYRGCREEYYLVIELCRQFYTEPRDFRIDEGNGRFEFIKFSNANIVEEDVVTPEGFIRHRRPIFDIEVSAEKQSPFSRAAQNETIKELYGMGLFQPENAIPALTTIEAMQFEGKDKLMVKIQENAIMLQQMDAAMNLIMNLAMQDDGIAAMAMQAGLMSPEMMADAQKDRQQAEAQRQPQQGSAQQKNKDAGTPEERAAANVKKGDNSQAAKERVRAANMSAPR